jgi:hypothetical protein
VRYIRPAIGSLQARILVPRSSTSWSALSSSQNGVTQRELVSPRLEASHGIDSTLVEVQGVHHLPLRAPWPVVRAPCSQRPQRGSAARSPHARRRSGRLRLSVAVPRRARRLSPRRRRAGAGVNRRRGPTNLRAKTAFGAVASRHKERRATPPCRPLLPGDCASELT